MLDLLEREQGALHAFHVPGFGSLYSAKPEGLGDSERCFLDSFVFSDNSECLSFTETGMRSGASFVRSFVRLVRLVRRLICQDHKDLSRIQTRIHLCPLGIKRRLLRVA